MTVPEDPHTELVTFQAEDLKFIGSFANFVFRDFHITFFLIVGFENTILLELKQHK